MKKILAIMLAFFAKGIIYAQPLAFEWAKQFGGTNASYGSCVAVDANKSVYSAGEYSGTMDCDPGKRSLFPAYLWHADRRHHKTIERIIVITSEIIHKK